MSTSIQQSKAVFQQCANRPWYAACLLLLNIVVVLGGPWACIVHCLMLDIEHHGHHHHAQHGNILSGFGADCPSILTGDDQQLREPPSAVTIAVVMTLALIVLLIGQSFQLPTRSDRHTSAVHPPPRKPPQISICFA